jgi:ribonuclease HI
MAKYTPDCGDVDGARHAATASGMLHPVGGITYWRTVTDRDRAWKRTADTTKVTQIQYLVQWLPTVGEPWAIRAYQDLGYVLAQPPHTITTDELEALYQQPEHEHLHEQLACEVCGSHADPIMYCDCCHRLYHPTCVGLQDVPVGEWNCEYCDSTQRQRHKRTRQPEAPDTAEPAGRQVVRQIAYWEQSWEPEARLIEDGLQHMIAAWTEEMEARPVPLASARRPDAGMTDLQKQGIHGANPYQANLRDRARQNAQLIFEPVNPHTDISPQGKYHIEIRVTHTRHKGTTFAYEAACIYNLKGQCVGQLQVDRLQLLYDRYQHTQIHRPHAVAQLSPAPFEEEVYKLILRYKQGSKIGNTNRVVDMKNHWATPTTVLEVVCNHLNLNKERFASPLNFHRGMQQYWSCHERDQLFGAEWDAFSCQWKGNSECNPEYEHQDMQKAVGWAVHSAQATRDPVLTMFVLPAWDERSDTAYNRWVKRDAPQNCHVLMRINRNSFKFRVPDAWKGIPEYAGNPRWDVAILLVGNRSGYAAVKAAINGPSLERDMRKALEGVMRTPSGGAQPAGRQRRSPQLEYYSLEGSSVCDTTGAAARSPIDANTNEEMGCATRQPLKFRKALEQPPPAGEEPPITLRGGSDVRALFGAQATDLLYDPASMIYTDGSVIKVKAPLVTHTAADGNAMEHDLHGRGAETGQPARDNENVTPAGGGSKQAAGSGIYIPAGLLEARKRTPCSSEKLPDAVVDVDHLCVRYANGTDARDGVKVLIDPNGQGCTNTITRAESAAIHEVLARKLGTTIATDSAAVMHQIKNMIMRPNKMRDHTHRPMLEAIVQMIRESPQPITIIKVKAHTGVVGNEMADEAAGLASKATASGQQWLAQCEVPNHPPYAKQYHPKYRPDSPAQTPMASDRPKHTGLGQEREWWHVGGTGKQLKKLLQARHRRGYADTTGLYCTMWEKALPQADGKYSNMFFLDRTVPRMARTLALHYRYGQLITAKMLHRWKKVDSDACLLCGEPDGGHHSLSGCPKLKGLYINRHNTGGRHILQAVLQGAMGASVIMHDLGHRHGVQQCPAGSHCPYGMDGGGDEDESHAGQQHGVNNEAQDTLQPDIAIDYEGSADEDTEGSSDEDADLHWAATGTADGLGTRIPQWMYDGDRSATAVADWNKFKPDILLVRCKQGRRPPETVPPKDRQVHIVEIKYCRDTDTTQQFHKAELQHQDLKAALLRVGYTEGNIHVHVIVLGVAGTIYKDIHQTLKTLGVDKHTPRHKLLKKLHRTAILSVMTIMKTKWAQESSAKQRNGVG